MGCRFQYMRKEDKLALLLGLVVGPGITAMTTALPHLWPSAPLWLWLILFWGGLTITAYAILFLIYDFIIRPHLSREVKLIPLTMIICGFLLIIGGIIYHLHKKPIEQRPIQPISETPIPAPPQQELPKPPSKSLSPQQINEALDNIPFLQKPEIAKHYIGIKVSWEGYLSTIGKSQKGGNIRIFLAYPEWTRLIVFEVNLNDYSGLGLLNKGDPIKVEGVIDSVGDSSIELKDATIISY